MIHDAACHCGTVRFRANVPGGLASARRCDCSFCAMRGAVTVTAPAGGVEILAGEGSLTLYRFNTGVARHWFCARCGIYTHHRRRSNPDEFGVNVACLSGQSPFLGEVAVMDGRAHPSDGHRDRRAGTLRYTATEAE